MMLLSLSLKSHHAYFINTTLQLYVHAQHQKKKREEEEETDSSCPVVAGLDLMQFK